MQISVIIPAYNEAARLGASLKTIFEYLAQHAAAAEVIVVDDGSRDNTSEVAQTAFAAAKNCAARVIRVEPNRGKGHAVRTGLLAAQQPFALFSDADFSTPVTETPKLIEPLISGECDLTFGSRALDRSLIGIHQPWRREQGGRVFNLLVKLLTGLPFWDTQCGFKAFRMDKCRPIIEAAQVDRFAFDVELLYIAQHAGLELREIPVRWDHYEGSTVSVARDSWRMLNEVRQIKSYERQGKYAQAYNTNHSRPE